MIIVADAGPILHLHWIRCSSWGLPQQSIQVVEQVWLEIWRRGEVRLMCAVVGSARVRTAH